MFHASFEIDIQMWREFKSYWETHYILSEHKAFEAQLSNTNQLTGLNLDISFRGKDHAGPSLEVSLLGIELSLQIYDNRHWNYDKETWVE